MGIPIDENKVVGRLDSHPIVTIPLWEGAPTSDEDEWTVDLCNHLLNDLDSLMKPYSNIFESQLGSLSSSSV